MPCNCGKQSAPLGLTASGSQTTVQVAEMPPSFTLQRMDGRTEVYGSRLEAEAQRVRLGGGTIYQN